MKLHGPALLALLLLVGACAGASHSDSAAAPMPLRSTALRDAILQPEIASEPYAHSAYALIERLRPQLLRARGDVSILPGSSPTPLVLVNGLPAGGLEALHHISAARVVEVRRLSGPDAAARFGTQYAGGAILVTLR